MGLNTFVPNSSISQIRLKSKFKGNFYDSKSKFWNVLLYTFSFEMGLKFSPLVGRYHVLRQLNILQQNLMYEPKKCFNRSVNHNSLSYSGFPVWKWKVDTLYFCVFLGVMDQESATPRGDEFWYRCFHFRSSCAYPGCSRHLDPTNWSGFSQRWRIIRVSSQYAKYHEFGLQTQCGA